jgi:hypothetical protein
MVTVVDFVVLQIERELEAQDADGSTYTPLTLYKVDVVTGDRRGAGTGNTV